jgi:isoleucyl-tRNA synthetase
MGDWNISRRRYYGLPLPFYPCECGHLNVVGSRAELEERALSGLDQLEELRRPWIDDVPIRCEQCGEEVRRIPEVGDVWLDAGIVPFSTLGWQNPSVIEEGYATGAAKGLTTADLPDHAHWDQWFPADWVSEMREQIRLWFYSQLFMSVVLTGRAPFRRVLGYEKMLDEAGREMHKSWGNAIEAGDAFARMGADVMRWQFCAQPPNQNLLFGFGPAHEIRRKLLTLWHSAGFLVTYGNIAGWRPTWDDLAAGPVSDVALDRWLAARTASLVEEATAGYEAFLTVDVIRAFESFVDDVSNWYIRRSRRRFWDGDEAALRTLWAALVQALRVVSPVLPFLAEHLWQALVHDAAEGAPDSVFLAGWPEPVGRDPGVLEEEAQVRRVVELGRQARSAAGVKLRQPLARLVVYGAPLAAAHAAEIGEELRVGEVRFEAGEEVRARFKPNLPVLGPRLGPKLPAVRRALEEGRYETDGDAVLVEGERLAGEDVLRERTPVNEGWTVAAEGELAVELDPALDDELLAKGRVYELIHTVNSMRREQGLELTDRIRLTVPSEDADLLDAHAEWIKGETLAVSVEADGGAGLAIARV